MFPISYRDFELMLADCSVAVDHTMIFRWIQAYAPKLEKRIRPHLRTSSGSWRVDETYVKVKGRWTYLYRAVDSRGQIIGFLLSARRERKSNCRLTVKMTHEQRHVLQRRGCRYDIAGLAEREILAHPARVCIERRRRAAQVVDQRQLVLLCHKLVRFCC